MAISIGGPSAAATVIPRLPPKTGLDAPSDGKDRPARSGELDAEQQKALKQLKARDQEVRAHEMAHLAAAGGIARSGANYTYQRGPDGQLYAVGGDVSIDASEVPGDPQATIHKAVQIRRAALAPANPSSQDLSVAAAAAQLEARAYAELARLKPGSDKMSAYSNQSSPPAAGSRINAMA